MVHRLLALVGLLSLPSLVGADPATLDPLFRKHGVTGDTPGIALLVLEGGKPVLQHCRGLARLRDRAPIHPRTTFELASLSKPFTALAILLLAERGKLSLSDDVRKHLPELPQYRADGAILLSELLQHVSGLPDYLALKDVKGKDERFLSNADHLPEFERQKARFPLRFVPGARYEYSNTGYMLLALVIERVSGKSYGTFLRDEVFRPLSMNDTWVYERPGGRPKDAQLGHLNAISYRREGRGGFKEEWASPPFRDETLLTTGDGAVWSSLDDLARWDAGLRAGKLLKEQTLQRALRPSRTLDGKTNPYGLGWRLSLDDKGRLTAFGHNGAWGGFRTSYDRTLEPDRTVILLSNRGDLNLARFQGELLAVLKERKGP